MSNHRIKIIAVLSALSLCAMPALRAQSTDRATNSAATSSASRQDGTKVEKNKHRGSANTTGSSDAAYNSGERYHQDDMASRGLQRAPDRVEERSVAKLKGQKLRDPSGVELGKIHDFIIDANTGKVVNIVISTGGLLGVGDTLRLIPHDGIQSSGPDGFRTTMENSKFQAITPIPEDDLEKGRFASYVNNQRSTTSTTSTTMPSGTLVRASKLEDKTVQSDNRTVGELERVIISLPSGNAMALVEADADFAGSSGKFLVPFGKLEIRTEVGDKVSSSLTRSDFTNLQSATVSTSAALTDSNITASRTAATSTPSLRNSAGIDASTHATTSSSTTASTSNPKWTSDSNVPPRTATSTPSSGSYYKEQLTPTGRSSADQMPASTGTVKAIRQAIDNDTSLARKDVQVMSKIVLQGTVDSEDQKERVEELAKQAAGNAEIDNQITVKRN